MPPVKKTGAKEDVVLKKGDDELLMDLTMDSVNGEDAEVKVVLKEEERGDCCHLMSFKVFGTP